MIDPVKLKHRARIAHAGALVNLAVHSGGSWPSRRGFLTEALAIVADVIEHIDTEQTRIEIAPPPVVVDPEVNHDVIAAVARFARDHCLFGPSYSYSSEMLYSLWRDARIWPDHPKFTEWPPELSHRKFLELLFVEFPLLKIAPISNSPDSKFLITGIQPRESESVDMGDDDAVSSTSIG